MATTDRRAEALSVLRDNRREGYTIPSATLYPFQWNWDSAFVAVGLAAEEPDAARREVETLLAATRPDGMLPHIVFWTDATGYFPGPEEWGVAFERPPENPAPPAALRGGPAGDRNGDAESDAPTTVRTSGITQPPMAVPAARRVYETTGDDAFLGRVLPALSRHLSWWDRERSPDGGLVYPRHPWETGMDDSPAWRDPLAAFDPGDVSYDRVGDRPLRANSVAGLAALYGGVPTPEQFDRLCETLEADFLSREYALPSYAGEDMDPDRYWRGPVWLNTNWLVESGLRRYDAPELADRVRADGRRLVEREGFREYFNPDTGEGRGSDRFSWTAALYLDRTA